MRIAIVSDIHGNLPALDAVIVDLERQRPDLVLHGGDLAATGPRPADVVDRVRELGWQGVVGNWDLVYTPGGDSHIHTMPPQFRSLFQPLVAWTGARLGPERIAWLSGLPRGHRGDDLLLLHASPADLWVAPMPNASNRELTDTYGALRSELVVYAHIHQPFVRRLDGLTVANSGSTGLPFDGDWRASYLLIEDGNPTVQRVEYDLEREEADLRESGFPFPAWLGQVQRMGKFLLPSSD